MQDQQPLKIFIVYAREDADALKELRVQLIPVARSERLEVWYDGEILPGQHWDKEIKTQLQSADIILLFISKHFFASEYIQTTELKEALERHEEGKSVVVPVIVRHCVWQDDFEVSKFQALPTGAQPIFSSHWRDHDEAMVSVVEGVKKVARKLRGERTKEEADHNTFNLARSREDFEEYLKKGFIFHAEEVRAKIDDFKKQEQADDALHAYKQRERHDHEAAEKEQKRLALEQREREKSQKEKGNTGLPREREENKRRAAVAQLVEQQRLVRRKERAKSWLDGGIWIGGELLTLAMIWLLWSNYRTEKWSKDDNLFVKAIKLFTYPPEEVGLSLAPWWVRGSLNLICLLLLSLIGLIFFSIRMINLRKSIQKNLPSYFSLE